MNLLSCMNSSLWCACGTGLLYNNNNNNNLEYLELALRVHPNYLFKASFIEWSYMSQVTTHNCIPIPKIKQD